MRTVLIDELPKQVDRSAVVTALSSSIQCKSGHLSHGRMVTNFWRQGLGKLDYHAIGLQVAVREQQVNEQVSRGPGRWQEPFPEAVKLLQGLRSGLWAAETARNGSRCLA